MKHFYQTTPLDPEELARAIESAKTQEKKILAWWQARGGMHTMHEVHRIFWDMGYRWPVTSVGRTIHSLTELGHLVKTDILVDGPLGKPNYKWRLAETKPVQAQLFGGDNVPGFD